MTEPARVSAPKRADVESGPARPSDRSSGRDGPDGPLVVLDGSAPVEALTPGTVLRAQRLAGNAATRQWIARRQGAAPVPAVQRSVYLANEDDYIYKSETGDEEYAYLYKESGNYPVFIKYAAIDKLKAEPIIIGLWQKNSGVEEYFRGDLERLLAKNDHKAATVRAHIGNPFLYDGKSGVLAEADLGDKGLAKAIAGALTGGAKVYQQGGGNRLPAPVGILTTFNKSKHEVFAALGIPEDRWPEYDRLMLRKKDSYYKYETSLNEARSTPSTNLFEYGDENTKTYFYYISAVDVRRNANAKIQIAGARMSDTDFANIAPNSADEIKVKQQFALLGTPTADSNWVPGTALNKKDRGEGQAKAMSNWNALGAAAYANKFLAATYPMDQNWEWLHVRGAQIGGVTDSTNLVPGLYVTNSFMIPYENMVAQWAQSDPTHFWARFQVDPTGTLFARYIKISIYAQGHKMLGDLSPRDLVTFDALSGKVVDKLANEVVKRNMDRRSTVDA